jgi:membrane protease YdiL (CAAX protease family)
MEELGALAQALFIILFVGGLSLLAQWGRKNWGAEISLIVILLATSVLAVVLVVGLGVLTTLARSASQGASGGTPLLTISVLITVLAGIGGVAVCVPPLHKVTSRQSVEDSGVTVGKTVPWDTTVSGTGGRAVGGWWADPPVFFALWMFVNVLAFNLILISTFALEPEAVGSALSSAGRLSFFAVFVGQLPFVVVALCGVGLGVRRDFRETLARLGYGPITLPQLGIVALFVVGALLLSFAADILFATLQPDLFEQVGEVSESLFGPQGLSPVSAILFALLIGVGAGLGEETLFRGALQPALGIPLVSVLWASIHFQYGPSILLVYIFVLSVGLGILRNRINTTASFLAHAAYNSLSVLLAYFLGA